MKSFILALAMFSSAAFAETVVVTSVPLTEVRYFDHTATNFFIDFETGDVGARVKFQREHWHCGGEIGECHVSYSNLRIVSGMVKNLKLVNEEVVFTGEAGPVVCGHLRPGTIFRNRKVLMLSGNCDITTRVEFPNVEVLFVTR